jgi:Na+/H+ antiporter NhaD/arsenite permease-like protein
MAALVGVVVGWDTHLDESDSIFGPVGLACKTPCRGDVYDQDYFRGRNTFRTGDVIDLRPHIDATLTENSYLRLIIRGSVTNQTKWTSPDDMFGPASVEGERVTKEERVTIDWPHPEEPHVIDAVSTAGSQTIPPPYHESYASEEEVHGDSDEDEQMHNSTGEGLFEHTEAAHHRRLSGGGGTPATLDIPHHGELTFTLHAASLSSMADQSVLIAALIMIVVYIAILLEPIHRTLIALFGSFVALFFLYLMHNGHTESISTIMLHMEWSTLGLLFGMMLLVGELSHTGIFEWCSVRLLVASNGSFNRLMVLLCFLVALSSAFLDNVTTMLLIAPVTIDMCNILGVDPRPYLIGEVLLSNVGGTATLIGDPPNIIIGSSFDEIGFVDFIINVLPCIFFFCVPVSLFLVLKIYQYYLTAEKMVTLNVSHLKKTYQVYDEPRLLIAGTTTFFVILMFFLHPVHHKDTAWIALLGAFITIAFTNPHDVQDALRNHVEWDTLLFFAGLFVLVEVCAEMGLLQAIGDALASFVKSQDEDKQLALAITLILWVSAITSAFLDNIPYTATMIPVVSILAAELPETLPIKTLAWALSFGACLGGNGTLLGASANIVTAGLSTSKGYGITFLNFFYPGFTTMVVTVAIANIYMLVVYVWI